MTLGEKIQKLRKQRGLSQEALAEKVTVTPVSYTHLDVYKRQDQDEAHLFSGFLFCGDCQQPMIRKTCLLYTSILLNSNMEYLIMQMVCGHEIGHDTFHRDLAKGNEPLPEFVLFDMRTKHE